MLKASRAKAQTRFSCEPPPRKSGVLVLTLVLTFCPLFVSAVAAAGSPVDQTGATMMSYRALIEASGKFDRKFVWVIGALKFKDGVAYLGEIPSGQKEPQENVCVVPIESSADPSSSAGLATLGRFDGLSVVSVHGRYESAATPRCPNGTVFAALLEVSFE